MRLDKYLSDMGVGTRSEVKKAISKGHVKVNGAQICHPDFKVKTESDQILFLDVPVVYDEFEYYMLNKPAGVISAATDQHEKTVVDLILTKRRSDLFPVGRLDRDTEGLLLITNDGALSHRLLSPKHHVEKVYYARIRGCVGASDVEAFQHGIDIGEKKPAFPARLLILNSGPESEIELTIREGRFHQVKRMFAAVGKEVLYLKRLRMGPIVLDPSLKPGEYRKLTKSELEKLC